MLPACIAEEIVDFPVQRRAAAAEAALMTASAYKLRQRFQELKLPLLILSGGAVLQALSTLHSGACIKNCHTASQQAYQATAIGFTIWHGEKSRQPLSEAQRSY